jgi:eukaryotic-like serine/threonine-protein kinase
MAIEDKPDQSPAAEPASTTLEPTRLPSQKELIGEVLNGRYVIESELKRGGMGVVYLARDQQLHSRPVVVKVLLDEAYQSEYVLQKFRQEVEALSRIDHPGIVGIVDAGELPNGRPFIVMQYVEGVTLRSVMSAHGMNLERIANLIKQIVRALAAAHERGIFHRDLKPENIMLQDLGHGEEQVKIIDFGIAKVKDSVVAPSTSLNLSPGTVAYMAPEQLSGRPISEATDIFALGAIAYEMVTGRKPFNPETGFELLQMQQTGVRVKPVDLRPSLPIAAQEVILKALAFNPNDRHHGPRDFGDNLARALQQSVEDVKSDRKESVELQPTQLSNKETPQAQAAAVRPAKTIPVAFQPAQPINPSASQLGFAQRPEGSRRSRSKRGLFLALAGALIAVTLVGGTWYLVRSRAGAGEKNNGSPSPGAERLLSYSLNVQKMRSGRAYQEPFASSGQEIFETGWKFRLEVTSPQAGYLYLLNEGPEAGETTYNMLFPAPAANSGSPYVNANQKVQTGWMVFDKHEGTEKFWMVWAAEAVPELEAVKKVVNETDKGAIRDEGQLNDVRDFLKKNSSSSPDVQRDKVKKETTVKGKGNVLVNLVELEHH